MEYDIVYYDRSEITKLIKEDLKQRGIVARSIEFLDAPMYDKRIGDYVVTFSHIEAKMDLDNSDDYWKSREKRKIQHEIAAENSSNRALGNPDGLFDNPPWIEDIYNDLF